MHLIAVNASPRKKGNTAQLISHALAGAESEGASTELIRLSETGFRGCASCFACKSASRTGEVRCFMDDGLTPVLEKIRRADALIIGSPVYIGNIASSAAAFIERFMFPYVSYAEGSPSLFSGKKPVGFLVTLGAPEDRARAMGYTDVPLRMAATAKMLFGAAECVFTFDTTQFSDYSKYAASRFDPAFKAQVRRDVFPADCASAFDMGRRFARFSG